MNRKDKITPSTRQKTYWLYASICAVFFVVGSAWAQEPLERMAQSTIRVICTLGGKGVTGSGFFIDDGKRVVTNWHVVEGTEQGLTASIVLGRENLIKAQVKWHSKYKDLAVLELEKKVNRPAVVFAPGKTVKKGDTVYAMGFPGAADDDDAFDFSSTLEVKVTKGIISAPAKSSEGVMLFQTDTAINHGNSGGPLFNEFGQVVGINELKRSEVGVEGIGWAIQSDELLAGLDEQGIPYQTASAFANNHLIRTIRNEPLLVTIFIMVMMLSSGGFYLGLTRRGREVVKEVVTRGQAALSRRVPGQPVKKEAEVRPFLKGVSGAFAGCTIEMDSSPITIGRDPQASQLVFPPDVEEIGRRHCQLTYDPEKQIFNLEDCWSTNGTYKGDGQQVMSGKPVHLFSSDRFYLSDRGQMFEVRLE